jgi:tetratricopeptide (TPR) repeat protein
VIDSFLAKAGGRTLFLCSAMCFLVSAGLLHLSRTLPAVAARPEELMYFPSGRFLKQAALGHDVLVADMAWLRAVQYYGEHRLTDRNYKMAGHIFDVVTTLDPLFRNAYIFGGLVLAQDAGDVEKGVELLHKGVANIPDDWLLPFELGFIYYLCSNDMAQAHRWFMEAAARPDHPESVERFAAFTAARAGDLRAALQLWMHLYESTENAYVRQMAEERIRDLMEKIEGARSGASEGRQGEPAPPPPSVSGGGAGEGGEAVPGASGCGIGGPNEL